MPELRRIDVAQADEPDGAHNLVLREGNVVLDNLTHVIGPMRYPVVRQQSAANPDIWESDAPIA